MNGIIQQLTDELKNNKGINSSITTQLVLESINNSQLLGVAPSVILENTLTTLEKMAVEQTNESLKEVVARFKKIKNTPTKSLENMAKEAGIALKLTAISESSIGSDPVAKHSIAQLRTALATNPEFKVLGAFVNTLSKYSYDKVVAEAIQTVSDYVDANRVKLEIINSIYEMRRISSVIYKDATAILENCLLADQLSSDVLKIKLGATLNLPAVNSLVNSISIFESSQNNKFNLGTGNGEAKISPVICPFFKVSENEAVVFVDNKFLKVSEDEDPSQISEELASEFGQFYETCRSIHTLGFKQVGAELKSTGSRLNVAFGVNESGNLILKINDKVVDDIKKIKFSEIFLMESIENRKALTQIFENLEVLVNLEFAKNLVNERLGNESLVFNFGERIYVFEKMGAKTVAKKMNEVNFFNYVLENFRYDVSDLYSIQLEARDAEIKSLNIEKSNIQNSIQKLEESIVKINAALADPSTTPDNQEKLNELKMSIEKNVNTLKSQFILVDQAKKKA